MKIESIEGACVMCKRGLDGHGRDVLMFIDRMTADVRGVVLWNALYDAEGNLFDWSSVGEQKL